MFSDGMSTPNTFPSKRTLHLNTTRVLEGRAPIRLLVRRKRSEFWQIYPITKHHRKHFA